MPVFVARLSALACVLGLGLGCAKTADEPGAAGAGGQAVAGSAGAGGNAVMAGGASGSAGQASGSAGRASGDAGAASAGAGSGGSSAGGEAAGGSSDLVDCDPKKILCKSVAPQCGDNQVPAVSGSCYGDCVDIMRCACSKDECPDPAHYTCWGQTHCGPFVR